MTDAENSISPQQALMTMLLGIPVAHAIAAAAELGMFARLQGGPLAAAALAQAAHTLEDPTYRLLRGLSAVGILAEDAERKFSLTRVGECLVPGTPGSFDALARMNGSVWGSAPFAEYQHSLTTGESGFQKCHGHSLFDWLSQHPDAEELFGNAMSTFSGMEVELVLGAYDFASAAKVVDVGGGHGLLLSRVLETVPAARGVLFDGPRVIERAKARWLESALAHRCELLSRRGRVSAPGG